MFNIIGEGAFGNRNLTKKWRRIFRSPLPLLIGRGSEERAPVQKRLLSSGLSCYNEGMSLSEQHDEVQEDDRLKEKFKEAFTLIELLVVIAIIAVLMGILIPSLRRVMQQARAVVCMNHLKQWGYCFEMYTSEHDGKFMPGIDEDWSTGKYSWIYTLMKYYNEPETRLCPEAKKTETQGGQLPYVAWDVSETNPADFSYLTDPTYKVGSYGINWWVASSDLVSGAHAARNKWRTTGQKGAANIPMLMDCGFMLVRPEPSDPAPQQDGEFLWSFGGGMRRVCTNRHQGKVNVLFMDGSTRKVRLKELWTLKWHRGFDFTHPLPEWPAWIETLP